MAFGWTKSRLSPIAIDFGADSLKLLQVTAGDPPQLVAAAAMDIPEEARANPGSRYAFYASALKTLLRSGAFKGERAVCSIPAYHTLVQHLQVQKLEGEDASGQIGLLLRQRLNVDASRMVLRHFDVVQVMRDNMLKQEVICFAASREAVMQHVDTARRAKLDVVGMHCEPVAILRAFEHLYRGASDVQRTTCFIDMGSATTKVVIAHGSQMVFAKTIHAAGDAITRHRAKVQGVSFTEARQARQSEAGAPAGQSAIADAAPARSTSARASAPAATGLAVMEARIAAERQAQEQDPEPISPVIGGGDDAAPGQGHSDPASETIDCLIDELQLCIRYHQSLFAGRNVEKLVFLGGESRHVATCQRIAKSLRIGAQLGDPLARMARVTQGASPVGVDLRQSQPGWAVPMGLCLSETNM